jgi:hypothetical protein
MRSFLGLGPDRRVGGGGGVLCRRPVWSLLTLVGVSGGGYKAAGPSVSSERCGRCRRESMSGGHGQELGEFLGGSEVAEGFAGPAVEFAFDLGQVGGAMHAEVGALRHPLA